VIGCDSCVLEVGATNTFDRFGFNIGFSIGALNSISMVNLVFCVVFCFELDELDFEFVLSSLIVLLLLGI